MPTKKPSKLRKREILLALALGGVGTFGAALTLSEMRHSESEPAPVVRVEQQNPQGYVVGDFDEVAIVGPQNVIISTGKEPSVRAEGSPDAVAQFDVVVEDGRLEIRPKEGFDDDWSGLEGATFYVTVQTVREIVLAGSGDVRIDNLEGDEFEGTVAGSGELAVGKIYVQDVDLSIAGPGDIVISGDASDVNVAIGGPGNVRAGGLDTSTASVTVAGPGNVELSVQEQAKMSIFGSGDVSIAGPASCSVSKMGGGNVTCNGRIVQD
ncbi:head GIN domain-containing protein [Tsuneonella sp. HG222]